MGSDESHFNVSVGSVGQSHRTVSTNHSLFEEKGEPKRYRTEVLPLTSLTPYRWAKPAHRSGGWERKILYPSLHRHHQNDSCIKMGSAYSHLNVSLTVRDIVAKLCPQTTIVLKTKESRSGIEPKPFCLTARIKPAKSNYCCSKHGA